MAWYRSCKKQSGEVIIAQLNDILTGPDSTKATASSTSQDGAIWKVFDGIKSGSEQDCWIPEYGSTNCWVCYQFSSPKNVTMCRVYFYQNMDGVYTGSIIVQGSNDGTNWTDISNSVSLNMDRGIHDYEIQTDSTTQYTYIRVFSADPLVVYGSASACTLEFEIYGYSEGTINNNTLFKNGQFYNQDVIKLGLYEGTVSSGKIEFDGLHAGFLIEELNLPSGAQMYDIYFKLSSTNNGVVTQCGTCVPDLTAATDMYDIIHYGTNRITYNTDSITQNTDYWFRLMPTAVTNSVFIGDAHAYEQDAVPYTVEEIYYTAYNGIVANRT